MQRTETQLQLPNTVMIPEPSLVKADTLGTCIEDNILLTPTGANWLTNCPGHLMVNEASQS